MFTYLIGREISDLEAAKWMACNNKGYFTHVTTLAEVKEQVSRKHFFTILCWENWLSSVNQSWEPEAGSVGWLKKARL